MKECIVAKSAGFCFGVSRSVKMAEEMLAAEQNCYSLGELIHNDDVVRHLQSEASRSWTVGADPAGRVRHHPLTRRQPCGV